MDGPCAGCPFVAARKQISFGDLASPNKRDKGLPESTYPGKSAMVAITPITTVSIQYMVGVLLVLVGEKIYDFKRRRCE